jgi:hypothetical protein
VSLTWAAEKSQRVERANAGPGRLPVDFPSIEYFASEQFQTQYFPRQLNFGVFSPILLMTEKLNHQILNGQMRGLTTCPCYRA